jgi:nicotinate phosphoribosyltransferase
VHALPEGTIFFDNEPILRIEASLTQAQLVESRVLNLLNFQTLIATKATRCRLSAPDAALVDFGMRRAHGAEAALFAARSSFLAGFSGTATVAAGRAYGIPTVGTMAHSFVQAHALEADAFRNFAEAQPENVVLLIDTYDTEAGARTAVELAAELAARNSPIKALRIDSGDLAVHARRVRDILDAGGHPEIGIFASGDLDEFALRDLTGQGAPVDGYGIGTRLDTSADAPYLNMVYKLQAYAGQATRKRSEGKSHWPAAKQVHREFDTGGLMLRDHLTLADEPADGTGLIAPVMRGGRRLAPSPGFDALRAFAGAERERLPAALRALDGRDYPVEVSDGLRDLAARLDRQSH